MSPASSSGTGYVLVLVPRGAVHSDLTTGDQQAGPEHQGGAGAGEFQGSESARQHGVFRGLRSTRVIHFSLLPELPAL